MSNIKQRDDFEAYQASKYVEWAKLDGVTPPQGPISEKQAFDEYIEQKTVSHKILPFIESSSVAKQSVKKWGTSTNTGWFKSEVDFTGLGVGDFLTVVFAPEKILNNDNKETIAIYLEIINVSPSGDSFNTKGYGWSNYVDSYSKTESDAKYELKGAGGGGGGGTVTPIEAPKNELVGHDVEGDYGLNLFDYNEMSRDNKFRVSGHTFITNDKQRITTVDEKIKKLRVYNRIKEVTSAKYNPNSVNIEATVIETSENVVGPNYKLKAHLSFIKKDGSVGKKLIQIPTAKPLSEKWVNDGSFGYLQFQIGGEGEDVKGKINIDAWYGGIKPNRQDQKFVFKNYNGIDLYKNGKGTRNIYRHMRLWDCIEENLNVVNLKDCKLLKSTLNSTEDKNILWIEAPEDCLTVADLPERSPDEQAVKTILKENLMSSNLCDITAEDADGTREHVDKPFFYLNPSTHEEYVHGKGMVEKQCFQIIIGREYAYKWRDHLSQTQIIYPTKHMLIAHKRPTDTSATNFKQLPVGGMVYILNNGQRIETNKYKEVVEAGSRGLHFTGSPFGYPDMIINYDNVASIIPNRYDSQDKTEF